MHAHLALEMQRCQQELEGQVARVRTAQTLLGLYRAMSMGRSVPAYLRSVSPIRSKASEVTRVGEERGQKLLGERLAQLEAATSDEEFAKLKRVLTREIVVFGGYLPKLARSGPVEIAKVEHRRRQADSSGSSDSVPRPRG